MNRLTTVNEIAFERLIFEIIETGAILDNQILLSNLTALRAAGAVIALDDFGTRDSNFGVMLEINPEFLKIDKKLVHGCHKDKRQRVILRSLANMSDGFGTRLIAKGVEEEAEFRVLQDLGINLMQGFLFSPPVPGEILMATNLLADCLI